ncbi:TetR/AcrR family transcriptional regulator [Solirubrobacter soli]|uniref:TetR/AcrR family transcriptional regulator n=1 Tax=Solirubrobacter soli TaxID=363832 RepID=UPI0003F7B9C5|nr:TetR/AcrR family transcriptional regulator [Solirubrobacter soli]
MSSPDIPASASEQRSDARRNRNAVIAAAIGLLAQKTDASMQEIAAASGVGRTTVYRHFPAREDLVRALFAVVVEDARASVRAAIGAGESAAEVLRRLGPDIVALGERYRFLEAHRELVIEDPFERPDDEEPLLAWLRDVHARGELRPELPPEWVYAMINALAVGANDQVVRGRRSVDEAGQLLGETFVRAFTVSR